MRRPTRPTVARAAGPRLRLTLDNPAKVVARPAPVAVPDPPPRGTARPASARQRHDVCLGHSACRLQSSKLARNARAALKACQCVRRQMIWDLRAWSWTEGPARSCFRPCGCLAMQQAALPDGPGFDLLSSFESGFGRAGTDVGGVRLPRRSWSRCPVYGSMKAAPASMRAPGAGRSFPTRTRVPRVRRQCSISPWI